MGPGSGAYLLSLFHAVAVTGNNCTGALPYQCHRDCSKGPAHCKWLDQQQAKIGLRHNSNASQDCNLMQLRSTHRVPAKSLADLLERRHFESSLLVRGDTTRLKAALRRREGVVVTAIGASNTVRGGCHVWQQSKCSHDTRYTKGNAGWLLQVFDHLNRTWPSANNLLINHGRMATPPTYFVPCVNQAVPAKTDLLLIAFGDMCGNDATEQSDAALESTFSQAVQSIIMALRSRDDAPTIALMNYHIFEAHGSQREFAQSCERVLGMIGQYQSVSVISLRNALFHDALCPESPLYFKRLYM